eukprot:GHRR01036075.1.p1 GENE.GHRR01036075.1~~GHRR01036075.1.p1  ORF type:complete len:150 (-),score=33.83 GHRR01036075.1:100-549(-)
MCFHLCHLQDDVTSVLAVGHNIIACSVDGTVRRFDIRIGRMYIDTLHHPVVSLATTHDGLCALAACLDSCVRLLDIQAGELLASYRGHTHTSVRMGCALLADDQHVVGCSEDGNLQQSVSRIYFHQTAVICNHKLLLCSHQAMPVMKLI